jgi:hypothetical protein
MGAPSPQRTGTDCELSPQATFCLLEENIVDGFRTIRADQRCLLDLYAGFIRDNPQPKLVA